MVISWVSFISFWSKSLTHTHKQPPCRFYTNTDLWLFLLTHHFLSRYWGVSRNTVGHFFPWIPHYLQLISGYEDGERPWNVKEAKERQCEFSVYFTNELKYSLYTRYLVIVLVSRVTNRLGGKLKIDIQFTDDEQRQQRCESNETNASTYS